MKIRHILSICIALLLAGCSGEDSLNTILSDGNKTPLLLETSLSTPRAVTRAANNQFANDDELLVYIQHVKSETVEETTTYTPVAADQAPSLVTFNALTAPTLYWDNFSNSGNADTDLRTTGHALRTYYGYCYNGGTPTAGLDTDEQKAAGKITWTIGNQSTAEVVRHADLLWSNTQTPVAYSHTAANKLTVPFTHAMSEVTVTIKTDATFGESPLTNTQLTLNNMHTVAEVDAPKGQITSNTVENIAMCGAAYTSGASRTFTAIVAPGTPLKVGNELLNIVDVEGNNYTLTITADMLKATAWAKEGYEADQNDIEMQSGVNYHLDVDVSKTAVIVEATLKDWSTVSTEGKGDIDFTNDIINLTVDNPGDDFADASSFRLYWKKDAENEVYAEATTSTYDTSTKTWTNAPAIYWPNGTDQYFFRALSGTTDETVKQSDDVFWGTTAAHTGTEADGTTAHTYAAGVAIAPRTGHVPLAFEHAMTKIVFDLQTTAGADKVDLTGAKIAISNLYTQGTISVEDGAITETTLTAAAISGLTDDEPIIVVPQTISNHAVITVTLKDDTKYKLQLNQCTDGTNTIGAWLRGKRYSYTITLKKEEVQFRALVKDWDNATGSGNATLDWD